MSHSVYKDQLRARLRRQTEDFIARGGNIDRVNPGVSGRADALRPPPATHFSSGPRQERTPVPEVVAAIELRKQQKSIKRKAAGRSNKPRRQLIYDDFGEPLRWEWVDSNQQEKSP
ncbi:MAG: hypothetical protein P1U78_04635 [Alcanivoracaceae bacterium]|nr:hypothetical protein [Alcanivoracaceae bacterium]